MAANKVRMTHPDLPGQPIEVYPQAVPVHMAAGWREAAEPPRQPKPSPAPDPEPGPPGSGESGSTTEDAPKPAGPRRAPKPPTSSEE